MYQKIITFFIILFIAVLLVKKFIDFMDRRKRIKQFLIEYFNEDELYNIDDIAYAFKLDKEHLLDILETLENYNYFKQLKKNGVSLVKDYYSLYEIKILLKVITKKMKL